MNLIGHIEHLDTSPLERELDAVRVAALAARPGGGQIVLELGGALLERLRWTQAVSEPQEEVDGNWLAHRLQVAGAVLVDCALALPGEDTLLYGRWQAGDVQEIAIRVGNSVWALRATAFGESRYCDDGSLDGPADKRWFTDLAGRMHRALNDWRKEHSLKSWQCPRCAFQNVDQTPVCAICGASASGLSVESRGFDQHSEPKRTLPHTGAEIHEIQLPADWLDLLEVKLPGSPIPPSPAATRVDVLLTAFPDTRRSALIRILIDLREKHQQRPNGLSYVIDLASHLPAPIASGISNDAAQQASRILQEIGSSVEIRPSD